MAKPLYNPVGNMDRCDSCGQMRSLNVMMRLPQAQSIGGQPRRKTYCPPCYDKWLESHNEPTLVESYLAAAQELMRYTSQGNTQCQ